MKHKIYVNVCVYLVEKEINDWHNGRFDCKTVYPITE